MFSNLNKLFFSHCSASASVRVPQPSWLNITMDAGLGSRANVFFVQRPSGKRSAGNNTEKQSVHNIIINPQATSTVAKRALETLVSLASIFPMFFLPPLPKAKKEKEPPAGNASTYSPSSSSKSKFDLDFWDVLLKLDSTSTTKKGKSVARSHVSPAGAEQVTAGVCATDSAHFQQLVSMLSYDLMKRSTLLTDRLLRLVNVMTQSLSETESLQTYIIPSEVDGAGDALATTTSITDNTSGTNTTKVVPSTGTNPNSLSKKGTGGRVLEIPENLLKLAVDVLTSKRCSQEALTDATSIFINISSINNSAMKWVSLYQ
jgi:E3 ubiquitin-protein ligase HUWE1